MILLYNINIKKGFMNKQIKIKVKLTNKEEIVHTLDIQKQQNFYY